jgi:hypothetical protein
VVGRHPPAEFTVAMIRIERVSLPRGLRAIARRDAAGTLIIYVAAELDARQQRLAVMAAVRASRRAGWGAVLPLGILLLGGFRTWLGHLLRGVRLHPAAWATGAAATTLGAAAVTGIVFTTAVPHSPLTDGVGPGPGGSITQRAQGGPGQSTAPGRSGSPTSPGSAAPSATQPQPGQTSKGPGRTPPAPGRTSPAPTTSSRAPSRSPSPSPTPSSTSATPTPTPTPTPSSTSPKPSSSPSPKPKKKKKKGSGTCVTVLGVQVCLGL